MREIAAKFFEKYKLTPSGIINAHEHNWKKHDDVIWLVFLFLVGLFTLVFLFSP